jgi:hypothetical protein
MNATVSRLRALSVPALPYAACIAPLALYQALYVNGFYPITEGWFSEYAHLIRAGAVPYRDFSLLLTPLYPLQLAAFQALFGEGIRSLNVLGIFVTCAIAIALFDLLRNFFNPWICALAAAIGTIYYQSGNAFIDYDFTQFVTLYLLIATALLVRSIKAPPASGDDTGALRLCVFSGFFFGFAVLVKQSNGGAAALAVGLAGIVVAFVLYRPRAAFLRVAALIGGFALPLAVTLLWLYLTGALHSFFADAFVAALHAKGGLSVFAWIPYYVAFLAWFALRAAAYLLAVIVAMLLAGSLDRLVGRTRGSATRYAPSVAIIALSLLSILVLVSARGICLDCALLPFAGAAFRDWVYVWSPTFYLFGSIAAIVLLLATRRTVVAKFLAIASLGIGLTLGNGMSSSISEISIFLGVAMLLAFLIEIGLPYLFPVFVPVALALLFCASLVESKFNAPYTWWQVTTPPVGSSACADTEGILQGLCIPTRDYASIMSIESAILANSTPGTLIYVYPHMPIFYLLSNRAPFDGAVVSWFDATGDQLADDVSRRLRSDPPPVIVVAEVPEAVMAAHEHLFRGGEPLVQRKILASIAYLRAKGTLQHVDQVKNLNGLTIDVYRSVR